MTNVALAIVIGALFATGAYLVMRRSTIKLLFGIVLLGNAANLLIFTSAGVVRGGAPLVPEGAQTLETPYPDPLAQALILTAIVISFGVLAFAMVLVKRAYDTFGTDDTEALIEPKQIPPTVPTPQTDDKTGGTS